MLNRSGGNFLGPDAEPQSFENRSQVSAHFALGAGHRRDPHQRLCQLEWIHGLDSVPHYRSVFAYNRVVIDPTDFAKASTGTLEALNRGLDVVAEEHDVEILYQEGVLALEIEEPVFSKIVISPKQFRGSDLDLGAVHKLQAGLVPGSGRFRLSGHRRIAERTDRQAGRRGTRRRRHPALASPSTTRAPLGAPIPGHCP